MEIKIGKSKYNINERMYPDGYAKKLADQALKFGYMCYNYYEKINDELSYLIVFSNAYGIIKSIIDNDDIERLSKCTWRGNYSKRVKNYYLENTKYGKMHRFIMGFEKGKNKDQVIDHIDRDPLNNSKKNLRIVTQAINSRNSSLRSDNTSGIKGVRYNEKKNRWESEIWINNKKYSKCFSVNKYGHDEALFLAKEFRRKLAEDNDFINPFD